MQNKLNINDWSSVQSLFDKLNKQMEKTLKAADSLGAPRVYIKMLVELEVSIARLSNLTHACIFTPPRMPAQRRPMSTCSCLAR